MTVLDYGIRTRTHRPRWRLLPLVVVIGVAAGVGVASMTYDILLGLLSRGRQLVFTDLEEPFSLWMRFAAAFGVAGAIVGCAATMTAPSIRIALLRLVAFSGIFVGGAAIGLVYACRHWNPASLYFPRVASAPMLLAPISGCVAVVVGLVLAGLRQVVGRRSAA